MLHLFRQSGNRRELRQQIQDLQYEQHRLITRNRLSEKICQAQKTYTRETFHEIRNALHVINGNNDLLYQKISRQHFPTELSQLIQHIGAVSRQLLDFINVNMELAKADSVFSYQPKKDVVDVGGWLQQVIAVHRGLAAGREVDMQCRIAQGFPEQVITDVLLLGQIAGNLLGNAIKFSPGGSRIRIDCFENASRWTLVFSNETSVATEEELQRLREPFQTGGVLKGSTGLGLAITRKYVQLLGGTIRATCLGKRFLVWLSLPLVEPALVQCQQALPPVRTDGKKVLVIEDNPSCQQLICRFLAALGLQQVTIAADAKEGIVQARRMDPDLIFLDFYLPDKNGLDILHLLRAEMKDTPVIIMSGDHSPDDAQLLEAGASECLIKPFGLSKLAGIIQKYLISAA